MTLQMTDTVLDRIERVKHSIANEVDPGTVRVAVDGCCPTEGCRALVSLEVHSDSTSVSCAACGQTFSV